MSDDTYTLLAILCAAFGSGVAGFFGGFSIGMGLRKSLRRELQITRLTLRALRQADDARKIRRRLTRYRLVDGSCDSRNNAAS